MDFSTFQTCSLNCSKNDTFSSNLIFRRIQHDIHESLNLYIHPPDDFKNVKSRIKELLSSQTAWIHSSLPVPIEHHPCFSKFCVEFIGSTSEGLSLDELCEVGFNIELDVTCVLETVQASHDLGLFTTDSFVEIQPSEKFPGYAILRLHHPETISRWVGFCNIVSNVDGTINEFYISPESVADEMYLMMCYRNSIENMGSFLQSKTEMSERMNNLEKNDDKVSEESSLMFFVSKEDGPAIKTTTLTKETVSFQYDCCTAIKCKEWPKMANGFKNRITKSKWLSKSQILLISSAVCILVPKSPLTTKTNLEWQYSFCLVEREIMQCLSDTQKRCYVFAKAIWRKFLKTPHGRGVTSYHLKNVVMWECEALTNEDWTEDLIVRRVHGIFQRLCKYLVDGFCPHFVLPNCNLFIDMEPGVLFRGAQRVQTVIFQFESVWIKNACLFFLEANQTRKFVGEELLDVCYDVMVSLLERMKTWGDEPEDDNEFFEHMCIEQRSKLQNMFGEKWANFALDYIKEAGQKPENIYSFICARAPPKELLKFAQHDQALFGMASLVSTMIGLGEMLDFLVKMKILETENFEQYGFHPAFSGFERLQLIMQYSSLDFGEAALGDGGVNDGDIADEYDDVGTYVCDCCDRGVTGTRFHCTECEDFDLCSECHLHNDSHRHTFVEINEEEIPGDCQPS